MNLYPLIADRVEHDFSILDWALDTLQKWTSQGEIPLLRAAEWRRIIEDAKLGNEGLKALVAILRDESEQGRRLKDFAPFAGVLSREERRAVFLKCAYDH